MFIDLMARIGWAYDLKTVSPDLVQKRVKRTGDGSEHVDGWMSWVYDLKMARCNEQKFSTAERQHIWGWDDSDMLQEDRAVAVIMNKKEE